MANTERGRYRMRDWEQDDTQPNRNANYDRDLADDYDDEDGYLPSDRPYEGLVGELQMFDNDTNRGEDYERGTAGHKQSDERIYDDINDHLTQHSYINATEITVSVKDGEVTLEGTVPDRDQKNYAEEVAAEVHGVSHVTNMLKIKKPQS